MLETLLKVHRETEKINFKQLWENGIFIFDANVLLDLYRLPESASNDLINVLKNEQFNPKIWVAFQVIVEFLNNRYEAISDQKNKFNTVRNFVEEAISQYEEVFDNLNNELSRLKLKQRHSLIDPDKFIKKENISNGKVFLEDFLKELSLLENKQSDVTDKDKIIDIVFEIFEEKIGEALSKKQLEELYKTGEKRYENNIPPGYKDKSKQGSYLVQDREFLKKYGDLILWKELINKAKNEDVEHIVLVTGDVKDDWWLEKRGKKLGPRKELLNEIYTEAPHLSTFYMYDTSSFLRHAKSELKLDISDSSINQAKDLIERSRRNRFANEEGYFYLTDFIKSQVLQISGLRVGIGRSVHDLPPVKIPERSLFITLSEIFSNVMLHGVGDYVGIQAKIRGEFILLRLKNKIKASDTEKNLLNSLISNESSSRGNGLKNIHEYMAQEGIDLHIVKNEKSFIAELYIPKSMFLY